MAADQRKKPVNNVRIATTSHDHGRFRNKNNNLGWVSRSKTVSLEWDDKNNCVVAKREQIGLSKRHLISIGGYVSHQPSVLADVLVLPREMFELDVVKEVLSYEVWQTLLSEDERQYLMQFLPQGVDMDGVVQELLVGNSNYHFANPFLKWCFSLCSGNLHPDVIRHQEHCIRASKKTYYADLEKYHNGMINCLLMWKERCANSKNPEEEIVQILWRSRKEAGNMSSESGSESAEENAGSSDNQNLDTRQREFQKGKVTSQDRFNNLAAGPKVLERSKTGQRRHFQSSDGSRYMSYIKVSRTQHQRVKSSMKHSGNSIQSRSLNHVLGGLHRFQIQPFEAFEEEERKQLHSHWLQLATRDVPAAFANFRRWQLAKSQLPHFWKHEMEEKLVSIHEADQDDEKDNSHVISPDRLGNRASGTEVPDVMEIDEKGQSDNFLQEHSDDRVENDKLINLPEVVKRPESVGTVEEVTNDQKGRVEPASQHDSEIASASMQNQHLLYNTELGGGHEACLMEADTDNSVARERDDCQPNTSEYSENLKRARSDAVGQQSAISTSSHLPPVSTIRNSYHHSTSNRNTGSAYFAYPEVQQSQFINVESDNGEAVGNRTWHTLPQTGSFLSPFAVGRGVQGPNELLHQHRFKGPATCLYLNHEPKHPQFDFEQQLQPSSSVPVGRNHYLGNLGVQLNMPTPLIDVDADQGIIRDRMFPAEGYKYSIPIEQHLLSPVDNIQQDWAASASTQTLPPLQSHLSGEVIRNSMAGNNQIRGGWSNVDSSSHVTGISRSDINQSLYGISSSQFSNDISTELAYGAPFDTVMGPPQLDPDFGGSSVYSGAGVSSAPIDNVLLEPHNKLMSGQEASSTLSEAATTPLSYNSAIQDSSMIKPFLRPWNS